MRPPLLFCSRPKISSCMFCFFVLVLLLLPPSSSRFSSRLRPPTLPFQVSPRAARLILILSSHITKQGHFSRWPARPGSANLSHPTNKVLTNIFRKRCSVSNKTLFFSLPLFRHLFFVSAALIRLLRQPVYTPGIVSRLAPAAHSAQWG